ncbi:MAG: helix-turn-helix transcriptional regulator [Rhodothermales bacterium]
MLNRELNAATTRPAVLAILAEGENYGYEIIQRVLELSDHQIVWSEGALYPMLHRLEKDGLIESEWRQSDSGRKRKYYRLKADGKKQLAEDQRQWSLANALLTRLWNPSYA